MRSDALDLLAIFGDPVAMRYWNTPPITGLEEMTALIEQSLQASWEHHCAWSILAKDGDRAIGMINYHHREVRNQRLEVGYILERSLWGSGVMKEALDEILSYCFTELGAHRVEASIAQENEASINLIQRLGFQSEGGVMRERISIGNGKWMSVKMFSLLEQEWRQSLSLRLACGALEYRDRKAGWGR